MDARVASGGADISYTIEGPAGAPLLLFINSIGTTRDLWVRQLPALTGRYRVIRYDARGHGRSSTPAGDYTIAQLGGDALAILDQVGAVSADVCGISLGGLTAMWLGVHAPQRVRSLVLANTAARIGSVQSWTERIAFVQEQGMAALAEITMPRWFTEALRTREPETVQTFRAMIETCPTAGYLGCCAALRDENLRDAIKAIRCPVLAIAGATDVATPPEALRFIHEQIAGSRLMTLDAAHLSNVEQHEAFTTGLLEFLASP
ncbi:MAG TPA: 3-oxoadipate enol-lactonase [Vicinamibacterales bacterium]|nr:3-oxoadipate enol-lactonase [Vicinamibacterales bacterium]